MTRLSFIYFASFLLFISLPNSPKKMVVNHSPFIGSNNPKNRFSLNEKLLRSYILGIKYGLSRKIKKAHNNLLLGHLFTPSGLHLTSFLLFIGPLFLTIKNRNKLIYNMSFLAIYTLPFFLTGYLSLKRIAALRIGLLLHRYVCKKDNVFLVFILIFFFDYLFGTYQLSPLSFTFSFLFIGTILSQLDKPYFSILGPLFGAHLIISYFHLTPLFPLGFLLGFLLSLIFSMVFPLFIIIYIFNLEFLDFIVTGFVNLIYYFSNCYNILGSFYSSLALVFITFILSSKWKFKWKKKLWLIAFLLHSEPLLNLAPKSYSKKISYNLSKDKERENIKKIKRNRAGFRIDYRDGLICYHKINNHFWEKYCRW